MPYYIVIGTDPTDGSPRSTACEAPDKLAAETTYRRFIQSGYPDLSLTDIGVDWVIRSESEQSIVEAPDGEFPVTDAESLSSNK